MDEGYIKFQSQWNRSIPLPEETVLELINARQILYQHHLIGAYDNGIGFGNISQRYPEKEDTFIISGSATGNIPVLTNEHFSLVTKVEVKKNLLFCDGPVIASSESMSHAVIYKECPEVSAVAHVHDLDLWKNLLHKVPTTDASAKYGSPEMAFSIVDLLKKTDLRQSRLFVMEGHEEGVFSFGNSLEEAVRIILLYKNQL